MQASQQQYQKQQQYLRITEGQLQQAELALAQAKHALDQARAHEQRCLEQLEQTGAQAQHYVQSGHLCPVRLQNWQGLLTQAEATLTHARNEAEQQARTHQQKQQEYAECKAQHNWLSEQTQQTGQALRHAKQQQSDAELAAIHQQTHQQKQAGRHI